MQRECSGRVPSASLNIKRLITRLRADPSVLVYSCDRLRSFSGWVWQASTSETLLAFIVECQKTGAWSAEDPRQLALLSWSIVHGVAKLAISHHLPFDSAGVLDFTDDASRAMLSGMANMSREQ